MGKEKYFFPEHELMIVSGTKIKDLKDISIEQRLNISTKKQLKFLGIISIMDSLIGRTDKIAIQLKERYYRTLHYIVVDIVKIEESLKRENNFNQVYTLEFTDYLKTRREEFSSLFLYRGKLQEQNFETYYIKEYIKKIPQSAIIKLLREVLLKKRIGMRKYNTKKK